MSSCYEVTPFGAGLTAMYAPLGPGEVTPYNILLSLPEPSMYETHPHPYFHSTIGPVANRVANARIDDLNGQSYQLVANNGPNTNHGGPGGWDKKHWIDHGYVYRPYDKDAVGDDKIVWDGNDDGKRRARHFTLESPESDSGLPGTVSARVWYSSGHDSTGRENIVEIEWEAELVDDHGRPGLQTPVAMTNHAYFNLNSKTNPRDKTLAKHSVKLATSRYLPFLTDNPGVPEGRFENFPGIPKVPFASFSLAIDEEMEEQEEDEDEEDDSDDDEGNVDEAERPEIRDIDNCFVLDEEPASIPTDTRHWPLQTLAELHGNESGIHLAVESTEPAFQLYTGKWIDVPGWDNVKGDSEDNNNNDTDKTGYRPYSGICIEPGRYVNAVNRKQWRDMVLIGKSKLYGARTRYIISRP